MISDIEITPKNKLIAGICMGILAFFTFILVINTFTVVDAGTTKVQTTLGTVNMTPYSEGLHFPVNPFSSFDSMDTRNSKYEVDGLNIPTQDRFNSTGNVTVLYRIQAAKTPAIKKDYGTVKEYIAKTLRQHLRSIIRDEGRKLLDSRSLSSSSHVTNMQVNSKLRLSEALVDTGIIVQDVLIQDIVFDPRIAAQILQTQIRIQEEEATISKKRITITNAEIALETAKGVSDAKETAADAESYRVTKLAEADKQSAILRAEGEAESIKLIADANNKLSLSLTPEIIEKYRLENEAILYSKSVGNVPTTIIGDTNLRAIGIPSAILSE